ncbi:hypothetical protein BT93_G0626 [Corymbia citriodora subsp. variegata]|nr:hypothetical protein BT93_G0626 [Corymbia citriodora subsp. variegata]
MTIKIFASYSGSENISSSLTLSAIKNDPSEEGDSIKMSESDPDDVSIWFVAEGLITAIEGICWRIKFSSGLEMVRVADFSPGGGLLGG